MATEEELMLAGKLYRSANQTLVDQRDQAKEIIYEYNQTAPKEEARRVELLSTLIDAPSRDFHIEVPTRIDFIRNVHLGKNFYANFDSIWLDEAPITIGDNVKFGPRVSVLTAGHPTVADIRNSGLEYGYPITIGDDVWIGGSATICPGVTIGSNVVIGAGAVVTHDVESGVIVAGVPAKVIRRIGDSDREDWERQKRAYFDTMPTDPASLGLTNP